MPGFNAGDIEGRLTLDRTPFQRELEKAQRAAKEFSKAKYTATLDADRSAFITGVNKARAAGLRFSQAKYAAKLSADRHELTRALKKAAEDVKRFNASRGDASVGLSTAEVENAVKKIDRITAAAGITVANNFRSPWRRFKWPAIFAGITAAAAALPPVLVGAGGAVASLAGAFKGPIGALKAFSDAQKAVANGSETAAEDIAKFEQMMQKLTPAGRAFVNQAIGMRDEMRAFGRAMQTAVLPGFTGFLQGIESAMPAITRGSAAVGRAISDVMGSTGALLRSPLFQGQLERAFQNSVPVVRSLGMFVRNLFRDITIFTARTRTLGIGLANMLDGVSNGFTKFFDNLVPYSDTLGQSFAGIGGIVEDLFGALGRFSGILSTGLAPGLEILRTALDNVYNVINNLAEGALPGLTVAWSAVGSVIGGVAAALAPLAGLFGGVVGAIAPFAVAMKAIDLITFGRVGTQFTALKANMKETEGRANKLKAGLKGLGAIGFGPLGLAALALGGILTALGLSQQRAAEQAAKHRQRVQELTQTLVEDQGALGNSTKAAIAKSLADQGAFAAARQFGYSLLEVTKAAEGNKQSLDSLNSSMNRRRGELEQATQASFGFFSGVNDETMALARQGTALANAQAALNGEARALREAKQAALEMKAAENGVTVATLEHWNALIKLNSELFKSVEANLAYRESAHQQKMATKAVTEALKAGKKGTDEYKSAVLSQERAILAQIKAKGEQTKTTNASLGPERASAKATQAMQVEAFNLAKTLKGPLPPAMQELIGGMSKSQARALGARDGVNKAGEAVRRLPNGKVIKITANTSDVWSKINSILSTSVTKVINIATFGTFGGARAKGAIDQYATGGLTFDGRRISQMSSAVAKTIPPRTPRLIGDNTARRESFIPHDRSNRSRSLLSETNRMMGDPLGVRRSGLGPAEIAQLTSAVITGIRQGLENLGVQVFIGDKEIQEIAAVAVADANRSTVSAIRAGIGGSL